MAMSSDDIHASAAVPPRQRVGDALPRHGEVGQRWG